MSRVSIDQLLPPSQRQASLSSSSSPSIVQFPSSNGHHGPSESSTTAASMVDSNRSDLLVSELEDNDVATTSGSRHSHDECEEDEAHAVKGKKGDSTVHAQPSDSQSTSGKVSVGGADDEDDSSAIENEDEQSEYSYDSDDDGHYAGFLMTNPSRDSFQHAGDIAGVATTTAADSSANLGDGAAVVPQDDPEEYGDTAKCADVARAVSRDTTVGITSTTASRIIKDPDTYVQQFASLEETNNNTTTKSAWKEPSQQAISMSLRAEKEKTGGKRRLAGDLYKIMMNDTEEAGFSVSQADEESMDRWTIKLFKFDEDSNLYKDMLVLGLNHVELEMIFPDQYPFEPPFVRVVRPRFKKQTGFVMNGALCMELLTNDGWNPVNDIESVIVSIRSLLVVGDGRLDAVASMPEEKREKLLAAAISSKTDEDVLGLKQPSNQNDDDDESNEPVSKRQRNDNDTKATKQVGEYSTAEAKAAYTHLSSYHKKKGWSGWWAQRG